MTKRKQSSLERQPETDQSGEIKALLESLKYNVVSVELFNDHWHVALANRKGVTIKTIDKRLAGTPYYCPRFGWDIWNGHYLVLCEYPGNK